MEGSITLTKATPKRREIHHLKVFLFLFDGLHPLLNPGVGEQFPDIDIGVMQQDIGVLPGTASTLVNRISHPRKRGCRR